MSRDDEKMGKVRKSNFELMRIFAIVMMFFHHLACYGDFVRQKLQLKIEPKILNSLNKLAEEMISKGT